MDELSRLPLCPVCGQPIPAPGPGSVVRDPLLTTPDARLRALALESGILTFADLTGDGSDGVGGAVAVAHVADGEVSGLAWVAEDLDDGLRADVLAFAIALLADPADPVGHARGSRVGIGSQRLPAAPNGAGHVAWHLAAACGRVSPSTTFAVVELPDR